MAWTTPRTWSPGELVTAGMMNLHVRDNLTFLKPTEGAWNPLIGGDGGQSGQTYSVQTGLYTKMDKLVRANFYVVLTNKGTITGNVIITLPFTSANFSVGAVIWGGLATSWVNLVSLTQSGAPYAFIRGCTAAAVSNNNTLVTGDLTDNAYFLGTILYETP